MEKSWKFKAKIAKVILNIVVRMVMYKLHFQNAKRYYQLKWFILLRQGCERSKNENLS